MKQVSSRVQLWLIAIGYAGVFAISAALLLVRYLQEISHPADVAAAGGMYAFGDLIVYLFIACLFMIPTFFLVRVMARSESAYTTYSQALMSLSLTAPVCLGLLSFRSDRMPENLSALCAYRLMWAPFIVLGIGVSWFLAKFARAKRLTAYAFLVETLTLCTAFVLFIKQR